MTTLSEHLYQAMTSPPAAPHFMSEKIDQLAQALALAQGSMRFAVKDATNPHLGNRYADLADCWEACREQLSKNGLSVAQLPAFDGEKVVVNTILLHVSGQWLMSSLAMPIGQSKNISQAIGSAITYGRRYGLSAVVGIIQDDDDGNASSIELDARAARRTGPRPAPKPAAPNPIIASQADQERPVFNKENSGHCASLENILEKNFPHLKANLYTRVADEMHGKTKESLKKIVEEIMAEEKVT